ncbi:hypothetical protein D3C85_1483000 [compost metagenome]
MHDALERHSVLYEFRIRIEASVEQMIFPMGFDDRAGIAVQVLLTCAAVLQHFAHFFIVHEIACAELEPGGSFSVNVLVLPPIMKIEQTECTVFIEGNEISHPCPCRLVKQV